MFRTNFTLITIFVLIFNTLRSESNDIFYNVTTFGASGNDTILDTDPINRCIDSAFANGGGTIYFPAGQYLSFSIQLKSNIRLYLDRGVTLIAASPENHPGFGYDDPEYNFWGDSLKYQDFGHSHWQNSLIWGIDLENITIEGFGLIYGKGLVRSGRRTPGTGNKTIALKNCKNVTIRDISILKGGHFCILPTGVNNFTIDNIKIDSNRDGINIDCCQNVKISNCFVNTPNDDAIVLKSSYALGYPGKTENISISNCQVSGFDMGTFLDGTFQTTQKEAPDKGGVTGRIKLGTESNGSFKNITISNCVFVHCRGLAIETVDGAVIEDLSVSNITMRDIVDSPFFIRLGSRMRGPEGMPVGMIKRINISNVTVSGVPSRYAVLIMGIPGHYVEDVDFNNIKILVNGGATKDQAEIQVPELENGYPDPMYFGKIPAYGIFVRHAKNIDFNNIEIYTELPDERPMVILDDAFKIKFNRIETNIENKKKLVNITNIESVDFKDFEGINDKFIKKGKKLKL